VTIPPAAVMGVRSDVIRAMVPGCLLLRCRVSQVRGFGQSTLQALRGDGWISGEYITASGSLSAVCLGEHTARQRWLK
jgi:hypothetical protein